MNFYQHAGKMALGSRLRRLGDKFTEEAAKIYALYDVPLEPKWFPVFYVLSNEEAISITGIAKCIGQAHPVVSQIVKEMTKRGLTTTAKSKADRRVNVVKLSEQGRQLIPKIEVQYLDVMAAVESLLEEMQYDLWKAIEETEFLLAQKDFYSRVLEKRKLRESQQVEIIDYVPDFRDDFKQLNLEGFEPQFTFDEKEQRLLDNPETEILEQGGHIFMARYNNEIVGTCALLNADKNSYQLAMMAVAKNARGKHIGWLLGLAILDKASQLGAKTVFLESNTSLTSAITLFQKLGFQKIIGRSSGCSWCNIQMQKELD